MWKKTKRGFACKNWAVTRPRESAEETDDDEPPPPSDDDDDGKKKKKKKKKRRLLSPGKTLCERP